MSYTKTIRKTITIPYSGSVSYGPSQSGGSKGYSGKVSEEVVINIKVETEPFEESITHCNTSVDLLTGAVVATEAAQIASINANAKKVSGTIVKGFFDTIRSEITQQIAELKAQVDATLLHLRELSKRCIDKQKQMERDYNGIAGRYLKVFDDLNNELSNRIYELNKPAFTFNKQNQQQDRRTSENDLVSTVTIFNKEGAEVQARIGASVAKKRAFDTIEQANNFLLKQKHLNEVISQNMLKEGKSATHNVPVCFLETQSEQKQLDKQIYQSDFIPTLPTNEIIADFQKQNWIALPRESTIQIQRYFNAEVNNRYTTTDTHTLRVKENVMKLLQLNEIESV